MVLLSALLIWGMRRQPREGVVGALEEIAADDPPVEDELLGGATTADMAGTVLEQRRLLTEIWGNDCPDLVVTFWSNPEVLAQRLAAHQQLFLPFQGGVHETLATLENYFFDGALAQGVPERSRFLSGYSFVRLPHRSQDIVVRSQFHGSRFAHDFFLVDGDGKLAPLAVDTALPGELIVPRPWLEFRAAVSGVPEAELEEAAARAHDHFQGRLDESALDAQAHAWMGHLCLSAGGAREKAARHVALALEFEPACQMARLVSARLQGNPGIRRWTQGMRRLIGLRTDAELEASYLLAQSLLVLGQKSIARAVCENTLLEFPRHPGTTQLLRQIDQKERGAQT